LCALLVLMLIGSPAMAAIPAPAQAGPSDAPILKHYGVSEGLPQSGVNALVQTRDGYLWVGTYGGLARFDGSQFTLFPARRGDRGAHDAGRRRPPAGPIRAGSLEEEIGGPSSDRIVSLHQDDAGRLWVGTQDGGLSVLDQGRFIALPICEQQCLVSAIAQDAQGTIWAATDTGIFRINPATRATSLLRHSLDGAYRKLARTDDGQLYAAGHQTLATISNGALAAIVLPDTAARIHDIAAAGPDLLVATATGLLRRASGRGTWSRVGGQQALRGIHVSADGATWLFAGNGDLWMQRGTAAWERVPLPPPIKATTLASDREGNLWVGTHNRGVLRLTRPWIGLMSDPALDMQAPGRAVVDDGAGGLWFGMGCGGLRHWQADGRLQQIAMDRGLFDDDCISSLLLDRAPPAHDGHDRDVGDPRTHDRGTALWIGMANGKLGHWRDGRQSVVATFPGNGSVGIWQAADGQRYAAAGTQTFKLHVPASPARASIEPVPALTGMRTALMTDARAGGTWFVGNRGAIRMQHDRIAEQWISGQHPAMRYARSLYEDEDGVLWIGTYGGGLNRIQGGQLLNYQQQDGLFDNTVSCILADAEGRLWLGGNRGISMLTREQRRSGAASLRTAGFTEVDGLVPAEVNGGTQSACHRDASGKLWFALVEGFAVIDPRKVATPARRDLPVHIERVSVNGQPLAVAERLTLGANSDTLEIAFTAINLTTPQQTQFRLRMSGSGTGDDWIDSGHVRNVLYPHVPWGDHLFEVQARNEGDPWPKASTRLWISRPMPWHQRPWIWLLSTFLGLVVLFAGYRKQDEGDARHRARLARLRVRISSSDVDGRR
jgi:ligand-binding sensor domain-containing protein